VLTLVKEKPAAIAGLGADAVRHLRSHGVPAVAEEVDAADANIGNALHDYLALIRPEPLVMGAYGHSRLREFVLGGATEHVLQSPKVATFLVH